MTTACTCLGLHLELGAFDPGCPTHDHPAAVLPSDSPHVVGRASSRRRVVPSRATIHLLAPGLVLVLAAAAFWAVR